ncbi:hypothetical protein H010_06890 [Hydrogenophaga taeniospiralis CCUG 15921]|uniref:NurA domain-containing protein n=1 Tax=Hydrogenophaga taeniospiralis CCUG 15921 TaxID=1281780 RepID=A0A9X4SB46_9BURK|nr:hypothetical protein [Hydrogenophaga taeniospiralis]MDG5974973.1 hypothetical protein [Hydrogenophaga taeniospiralis CCUG 15921]
MPYEGQQASKRGHIDIVKNDDVKKFLSECAYLTQPGDQAAVSIAAHYKPAPKCDVLPQLVVASDGSAYSEPIDKKFPSTQVGYVKTSFMAFDMGDYNGLVTPGSPFVDPYAAASLHNKARAVAFTLPGSNVRYKGLRVQDGFRRAVYEQLSDERTQIPRGGFSVKDMLYHLEGGQIAIEKCPSCGQGGPHLFKRGKDESACSGCGATVYVTDSLRIHEQISDQGDNSSAITRFMNAVEHLQLATLLKAMADNNLSTVSGTAIMVDGPLALFGQPARYHASIQAFYYGLFERCESAGLPPPLIMGMQKDGMVMEHARALSPHLKNGTFCAISDQYRAEFINGIAPLTDNFGHETYYGQDFIYKTDSGRIFDVCLAYPFANKRNRKEFSGQKADPKNYDRWLARAFALIRHLEFDLYENSVVPVALAHRHASISLSPGGTLLDVLTKKHLS